LALDKITSGGLAPHTEMRGMVLTEAVVIFDAAPKVQVQLILHKTAALFVRHGIPVPSLNVETIPGAISP
jgi:hypothetical protein